MQSAVIVIRTAGERESRVINNDERARSLAAEAGGRRADVGLDLLPEQGRRGGAEDLQTPRISALQTRPRQTGEFTAYRD